MNIETPDDTIPRMPSQPDYGLRLQNQSVSDYPPLTEYIEGIVVSWLRLDDTLKMACLEQNASLCATEDRRMVD
jgi:hypothetical protein